MFLSILIATLAPVVCIDAQQSSPVTKATLSNGLRVVIIRNDYAPVVAVRTIVMVGGSESPVRYAAIAHAQEHMAFRGCSGFDAAQIAALYAELGDDNNAVTGQETTEFYATVPASDLDVVLEAQERCLQSVDDAPSEWKQERKAIEEEVFETSADPEFRAWLQIKKILFAGTPYANDSLGTQASLEKISSPMLKSFFERWYTPSNTVLVVSGAVDPEHTLDEIKLLYSGIPRRNDPPKQSFRFQTIRSKRVVLSSDLPYALVTVGYRLPGSRSPDYGAMIVLSAALSRFERRMTPPGFSQDDVAQFSIGESYREASVGLATVTVANEQQVSGAPLRLRQDLERFGLGGVSPELFETTKRQLLTDHALGLTSAREISEAWARALAEGLQSPDDEIEAIRRTTVEDVNRVARTYLLHVGTAAVVLRNLHARGFGNTAETPAPDKAVTSPKQFVRYPEWAAKKLGSFELPEEQRGLQEVLLQNGMRLIVRRVPGSKILRLFGSVTPIAPESAGKQQAASQVLDALYAHDGVGDDRAPLEEALHGFGATGEVGSRFTLQGEKNSFPQALAILAEREIHPDVSELALSSIKKDLASRAAPEESTANYRSDLALDRAILPPGDPVLHTSSMDNLRSLSIKELSDYQKKRIRPDLTSIVLTGDISFANAQAMIEAAFADWKATGPRPSTVLPSVPPNRGSVVYVSDRTLESSSVTMAEELSVPRDDPDQGALLLGIQILAGGFYAGRLYQDLRQADGLVYSVEVNLDTAFDRTIYEISFDCQPRYVTVVRSRIESELKRMQTQLVTDAELRRAKASLLRQSVLSRQSPEEEAEVLLDQAADNRTVSEADAAVERLKLVTPEDVRSAFSRRIRVSDFAVVIRGPRPR
ncbi:MAG TPA: insulinase family protein [Acidobacteriaceae bacterium]